MHGRKICRRPVVCHSKNMCPQGREKQLMLTVVKTALARSHSWWLWFYGTTEKKTTKKNLNFFYKVYYTTRGKRATVELCPTLLWGKGWQAPSYLGPVACQVTLESQVFATTRQKSAWTRQDTRGMRGERKKKSDSGELVKTQGERILDFFFFTFVMQRRETWTCNLYAHSF